MAAFDVFLMVPVAGIATQGRQSAGRSSPSVFRKARRNLMFRGYVAVGLRMSPAFGAMFCNELGFYVYTRVLHDLDEVAITLLMLI